MFLYLHYLQLKENYQAIIFRNYNWPSSGVSEISIVILTNPNQLIYQSDMLKHLLFWTMSTIKGFKFTTTKMTKLAIMAKQALWL